MMAFPADPYRPAIVTVRGFLQVTAAAEIMKHFLHISRNGRIIFVTGVAEALPGLIREIVVAFDTADARVIGMNEVDGQECVTGDHRRADKEQ